MKELRQRVEEFLERNATLLNEGNDEGSVDISPSEFRDIQRYVTVAKITDGLRRQDIEFLRSVLRMTRGKLSSILSERRNVSYETFIKFEKKLGEIRDDLTMYLGER